MGKFSMKGLTVNNDTYAYVRTIPKALLNHPSFSGRRNYRKQIGPRSLSDEQLFLSWKQAHDDFEQYIDNLKQINIDVIDRNALIKRAESYLRANNLNAGMLSNNDSLTKQDNQQHQYELKQMIEHSGIFDELFEHATKQSYEEAAFPMNSSYLLPAHLQVQRHAWKILTQPAANNKVQYLFSDCWTVYATKKGLNELARTTKRIKATYCNLLKITGDQVLNEQAVDDALVHYVDEREATRDNNIANGNKPSPSPASIERELNTLLSIFRTAIKKHRLKIVVERPEIREDIAPIERHTFTDEEQLKLANMVSDTAQPDYQPYKELMILLMVQSGTHITELLRLKRDKVKLNHGIPHIILDGELKTQQRKRVIPLVFKVERIKQLANMFLDDTEHFFGEENAKRTADNYSAQLNKICKRVNPNSTSYSCRHSFKHHAQVKGIDTQIVANLGGWSGKDSGLSRQMLSYGASGLLNTDSLLRLQDAMLQINEHLIEADLSLLGC
jgi:integrase